MMFLFGLCSTNVHYGVTSEEDKAKLAAGLSDRIFPFKHLLRYLRASGRTDAELTAFKRRLRELTLTIFQACVGCWKEGGGGRVLIGKLRVGNWQFPQVQAGAAARGWVLGRLQPGHCHQPRSEVGSGGLAGGICMSIQT